MGSLDHPPKIGKSGAQKIAAILDDPDKDLTKAMTTVGKGFFADPNQSVAPKKATIKAIGTVRAHYQSMGRRIDKVETSRKEAKKDVLDALKRFEASLSSFAKALPDEATADGEAKLKSAARKAVTASSDLEKARAKLS
jgi:hypothetical protein